jgi:hypothetical protein
MRRGPASTSTSTTSTNYPNLQPAEVLRLARALGVELGELQAAAKAMVLDSESGWNLC